MKKVLSIVFALVLVMAMGTVAFAAEDQDASFTKTYEITNDDTVSPAETFTFTYTADKVTDSNKNLQKTDMPAIDPSTVDFAAGAATTDGLEKEVAVALANVTWPGVGVYYYTVKETAGTTAGVTYDATEATLKVTVAYDDGTDTYYTAFVTLNLDDENEDDITDSKVAGFTNTYSAGDLAISKTVTGNLGDKSAYFNVKVKLTGVEGKTYAETYTVTGGSKEGNPTSIKIGTETTFALKNGETITIKNLPYDVTYTVVEDDYTTEANGAYDEAEYDFSDDGKKIDSAEDTVEITNNKGIVVDTGIALDSIPYVLVLGCIVVGMTVLFLRKRRVNAD